MSASQLTRIAVAGVFVTLSAAIGAFAQPTVVVDSVSDCDYRVCALTIAPRWNGLAIVRGTSGATIANLGFFMPHDISAGLGAGARTGALGLSVPFQFGADGALSRAVWWHNLRYAGTPSRQ